MARNLNNVNKKELIKILTDEFGYELEDIKLLTNGKLKEMIIQEDLDEEEIELNKNRVVSKTSRIKDNDLIVVMNGVSGSLTHRSLVNGRTWHFKSFGQTDKFPYSELVSLRNKSPRIFEEGWIIILDKDVQNEFGLTEIYKNIITTENIDSVFDKDVDSLDAFIDALPEAMKVTFFNKARQLFQSNKIDRISIVKLIENKFNLSLEDNSPLNDTV